MVRLFLPPEFLSSREITITDDNARYLITVLRIRPGELLMVLDGLGNRYLCRVLGVHKKGVVVEKIERQGYSTESPLNIILAQGIAKGEKMNLIIQKATELGVTRVIPLITERSQVRHTEKVERWRRIATSASQQSGREIVPEIEGPLDFNEFIRQMETGGGIIFFEEERVRNLKQTLNQIRDKREVILLIGPEGGFTDEEVNQAFERGFMSVSLGPRILRTETATITALSIIQYELGDMG
ncbi:MAG: 16S rRNA (uracil(1498)-N(3))-methyltransferase [Thermodesulfovibrionia bacterium]